MDKKLKYFIIAITGVTCFSLLLIVNFNLIYIPIAPPKESVSGISLIVDYNNGTIRVHKNFTLDNGKTTAFDALDKWCDVKYTDFSWGIFVEEIDGISGGINGGWIYMVNNITPNVGSPNYPLDDKDEVEWLIREFL